MFWLLVAVPFVFLIAFAVLKRCLPVEGCSSPPYSLSDNLLSPTQHAFLGILEEAVGVDFRVFGKVRVDDVISMTGNSCPSAWRRMFDRVSARHFDFVLCRPDDLRPLCAVALNERSQDHGASLTEVCDGARLPLVFFPTRRGYSTAEVREAIFRVLSGDALDEFGYRLEHRGQ